MINTSTLTKQLSGANFNVACGYNYQQWCDWSDKFNQYDKFELWFLGFIAESMQEKAINLGCMELLELYIQTHHSDDTMCQMALMCVGSLADSGDSDFVLLSTCIFFR